MDKRVVHKEVIRVGWYIELCNGILKANPNCHRLWKKVTCKKCLKKLGGKK